MEVLQPDSRQQHTGKEGLKPAVKPKPKLFPKPSLSNKLASSPTSAHSRPPISPASPTPGNSRPPLSPASPTSGNSRPSSSPAGSPVSPVGSLARSLSLDVPSAQKINCLAGPRPYSSSTAGSTFIRRTSFRLGRAGSITAEETASLGNEAESGHGSPVPRAEPAAQRDVGEPSKDQPAVAVEGKKGLHSSPVMPQRTSSYEHSSSLFSNVREIVSQSAQSSLATETVDGWRDHNPAAGGGTDAGALDSPRVMSHTPPWSEQSPPASPWSNQSSEVSTAEHAECERSQDKKRPPLTERKSVSFKVKPVAVGQATRRFPGTTVEEILAKIEQERLTPDQEKSRKAIFSFEQSSTFNLKRASFRKKGPSFSTKVEESGSGGDAGEQDTSQVPGEPSSETQHFKTSESVVTALSPADSSSETWQPIISGSDVTTLAPGEVVHHIQEQPRMDIKLDLSLQRESFKVSTEPGAEAHEGTGREQLRIQSPEWSNIGSVPKPPDPEQHQDESHLPVCSKPEESWDLWEKPPPAEVHDTTFISSIHPSKPVETSSLSSKDGLDVPVGSGKFRTAETYGSDSSEPLEDTHLTEISKATSPCPRVEQQLAVTDLALQLPDQTTNMELGGDVSTAGIPTPASLDQSYPTALRSMPDESPVQEGERIQGEQLIPDVEKTSTTSSGDVLQGREMLLHEPHLSRPLSQKGAHLKVSPPVTSLPKQTETSNREYECINNVPTVQSEMSRYGDSFESLDSEWTLSDSFVWSPGSGTMMSEMAQQVTSENRSDFYEVPSESTQVPLRFWIGATKNQAESASPDLDNLNQGTQEKMGCFNLSGSDVVSLQTPNQELLNIEHRIHEEHENPERDPAVVESRDIRASCTAESGSEDHSLSQSPSMSPNIEIPATQNQGSSHSPAEMTGEHILPTNVLSSVFTPTTMASGEALPSEDISYSPTLIEMDIAEVPTTEGHIHHHSLTEMDSSFPSTKTSQAEVFTAEDHTSGPTPTKTETYEALATKDLSCGFIPTKNETSEALTTEDLNYSHMPTKNESFEVISTKTSDLTPNKSKNSKDFLTEEQTYIHSSSRIASTEVPATKDTSPGPTPNNIGIVEDLSTLGLSQSPTVTESATGPVTKDLSVNQSPSKMDSPQVPTTVDQPAKAANTEVATTDLGFGVSPTRMDNVMAKPTKEPVYESGVEPLLAAECTFTDNSSKYTVPSITPEGPSDEASQGEYPGGTEEMPSSMMPSVLQGPMRHLFQDEEETLPKPSTINQEVTSPNQFLPQPLKKDNSAEEHLLEFGVPFNVKQLESPTSSLTTDTEQDKAILSKQFVSDQDAEGELLKWQMAHIQKENEDFHIAGMEDVDREAGFLKTVAASKHEAEVETLSQKSIPQSKADDNQDGMPIGISPVVDHGSFQEVNKPNIVQEAKMETVVTSPINEEETVSYCPMDKADFYKTNEEDESGRREVWNVLEPIQPLIKLPPSVEPCVMFHGSPLISEQATLSQDGLCMAESSELPCGESPDSGSKERSSVMSPQQAQFFHSYPAIEEQRTPASSEEVLAHARESSTLIDLTNVDAVNGGDSPDSGKEQAAFGTESQQLGDPIPTPEDNIGRNGDPEELKTEQLEQSGRMSPRRELEEHVSPKSGQLITDRDDGVGDVDIVSKETSEDQQDERMEYLTQQNSEEVQPERDTDGQTNGSITSSSPGDVFPSVTPKALLDGLLSKEQQRSQKQKTVSASQSSQPAETKSEDSPIQLHTPLEDSGDPPQPADGQGAHPRESTVESRTSQLQPRDDGAVSPCTGTDEGSASPSQLKEDSIVSQQEDMKEGGIDQSQPEKCGAVGPVEAMDEGSLSQSQLDGEQNLGQSKVEDVDMPQSSTAQDQVDTADEVDSAKLDFSFLQNTSVLDTAAHRSRADLNRKRGHRARITRPGKDRELDEIDGDDWIFRDSTELRPAKTESEDLEEKEKEEEEGMDEEEPKKRRFRLSKSSIFQKLDHSSQKGRARPRNKSEAEEKENETATASENVSIFQRSKSFKLPSLGRISKGEKGEKSERSSPQWLQALKLKKKSPK